MANLFESKNPAGSAAAGFGSITGVMAVGAMAAHRDSVAAMHRARANAATHELRYQLDYAIDYSQILMDLASEQAAEIVRLKAENARIKAVAEQNYNAVRRLSGRG
jgi:hypothetical protein